MIRETLFVIINVTDISDISSEHLYHTLPFWTHDHNVPPHHLEARYGHMIWTKKLYEGESYVKHLITSA